MQGRAFVDKIERTYHFALVGLEFLDLELASPMSFPLHLDTANQGARLKISGNGDGEVHDGIVEYFGFVVSVGGWHIFFLPVLLLLKDLVPQGECILAQVDEVGWDIVFCNNYLGLLAKEILQGGARLNF